MSTGLTGSNPQNEATPKSPRTRSKIDFSREFWNTNRFGEIAPHLVIDGIDSDKWEFGTSSDVQSYTLKAPLMQNIKQKKSFFRVNYKSILPLNWEKFYNNPTQGQDVNDNVGTGYRHFWYDLNRLFVKLKTDLSAIFADPNDTDEHRLTSFFRWLVLGEYLYSNGNLLSCLGVHGNSFVLIQDSVGERYSFDHVFDEVVGYFASQVLGGSYFEATFDDGTYAVYLNFESNASGSAFPKIPFRMFLDKVREELSFEIYSVGSLDSSDISSLEPAFSVFSFTSLAGTSPDDVPLNLDRLWAYQLTCAHFFTNDHIDYIYSADLFRQYVNECGLVWLKDAIGSSQKFSCNGLSYFYDAMSAYVCENVVFQFFTDANAHFFGSNRYSDLPPLDYLSALFAYRRSLRFLDYFTGSRPFPLAVGDTNAPVVGGQVSVIDVTKKIQVQRFLNAINRSGRKNWEYLKELFGVTPSHDAHDPYFLASTEDFIYGDKNEYTGLAAAAQANNITALLKNNGSRYRFECDLDDNGIILGLTYYDISRAYSRANDRQTTFVNRFDYFNPFMQYIGDQKVYRMELGVINSNPMSPFSYQLRHMEYKQGVSMASGGFCEHLPGWSFLADDAARDQIYIIDPNFIRNNNVELDKFYVSLTGWSQGSYFHFIVRNFNTAVGSRPMAYAPSIL